MHEAQNAAIMLTTLTCHNVYSASATTAELLVTFEAPSAAMAEAVEERPRKKGRKAEAAAPPKAASPPVYLTCALDVSGSMTGQKLCEVQQTMLYIASTL